MIDATRLPLVYSFVHYAMAAAAALISSLVAGYFPGAQGLAAVPCRHHPRGHMSDTRTPAVARDEAPADEPLIAASGVTRILPGVVPTTLVHDIDLTIGTKEYVAITGPSGSGKSSLLYLLGLLDLPTAGEVRIRGRATAHMDEAERALTRLSMLGFVFQFHFLLPEFSALENVMLPMKALGHLSAEAMRERAASLLASLGLADHALKRPDQLSGGQRQRVAVARALANDPPCHSCRRADRVARLRRPASRCSRSCATWSISAARRSWLSPTISIWRDAWTVGSCCRTEVSCPMMQVSIAAASDW